MRHDPVVPDFRHLQFCPIARAAEVLGERWTILIVRELLFGPQRFSDLRRRLMEVSPSVLTERLANLEQNAIVTKSELAPPAASVVYELTETGRGLGPVIFALAHWGKRFLLPIRPGEQLDADRLPIALSLYARASTDPECAVELRVVDGNRTVTIHARGGEPQTVVSPGGDDAAGLVLEGDALDLIAVAIDAPEGRDALERRAVKILRGPRSGARIREFLNKLFTFGSEPPSGPESSSPNPQP